MVDCGVSQGWFNPFEFEDEYVEGERPQLQFTLTSTAPATWWRMNILNNSGEELRRIDQLRSGLSIGTVSWNGKDGMGHTVPNGTYTAELTPLDEYRNPGGSCLVSFIVDSPLQR